MAHGGPSNRKSNNNIDDNNSEDELPPPPDGGWGWVVVAASFLIHIITDGITYSFGVVYVELLSEFQEGKGYTSWITSILAGMTLCIGPISSSFVDKFGCRAVTIAGSILAAACLLISYWATNVFFLIITIGFGVGCGLGLIYLPAIVSVTTYFEKYRSVATGIAVAGSGLGTFIFAPLIGYFIKAFTWRGTMMVLSGIVLNCSIFGALFRPLTAPSRRQIAPAEPSDTYQRESGFETESLQNNHQNGHGHAHMKRKPRTTSVRVPSVNVISEVGDGQMIRSHSVGHSMAVETPGNYDANKLLNINYNCNGRQMNGDGIGNNKPAQNNGKSDGMRYTLSQPLLIHSTADSEHENKPLKESHKHWRSGTLSRPDVFYQGSLYNIPNYRSHSELPTDADRYGSLRRVDENEELSSDEVCCGCIPADTRDSFIEMINFNLLKDPIFVLFSVSNFATSLGFYVPYFCLADQAKLLKMSEDEAGYLLSIIGGANTLGRIILGYISDKSWVNRLLVYNVCLVSCGVATSLSVICLDFYSLAIFSAVFGFTIGAYVGLTSVILVDLLGLDKLTNAFGLLLLFQGIATFVGSPIVGFLFDRFNSYTPGFLFAGIMIAVSGFILFFIPSMQRQYAQQQLRIEREHAESVIAS